MKRYFSAGLALVLLLVVAGFVAIRPSNEREWSTGQQRLPYATFDGAQVTIHNLRNFEWRKDGSVLERWEDRTYDLDELESAWFALAPIEQVRARYLINTRALKYADDPFFSLRIRKTDPARR